MDQAQIAAFGRRVREARRARGMNQAQLAEAAEVAVNTLSAIEQGKHEAHPSSTSKIAAVLDLEPAAEAGRAEIPADVKFAMGVVEMWLTGIPAEERPAAFLGLARYLGSPVTAEDAPELDRSPGRGRGKASDLRKVPTLNDLGP